jgi:hypothetical protein
MSDLYTAKSVKSDFAYARQMMRDAVDIMKNHNNLGWLEQNQLDWDDIEQVALELTASASAFLGWVEQERAKD